MDGKERHIDCIIFGSSKHFSFGFLSLSRYTARPVLIIQPVPNAPIPTVQHTNFWGSVRALGKIQLFVHFGSPLYTSFFAYRDLYII